MVTDMSLEHSICSRCKNYNIGLYCHACYPEVTELIPVCKAWTNLRDLVRKLLLAWPLDGESANIPPYLIRELVEAVNGEARP
jgi:hypothetical protein